MMAKYYCWSRKVRGVDGGRTRVQNTTAGPERSEVKMEVGQE